MSYYLNNLTENVTLENAKLLHVIHFIDTMLSCLLIFPPYAWLQSLIFRKKVTFVFVYLCLQVRSAVQQMGFLRHKRGYKPLNGLELGAHSRLNTNKDLELPTDPDFDKEWYLVSTLLLLHLHEIMEGLHLHCSVSVSVCVCVSVRME